MDTKQLVRSVPWTGAWLAAATLVMPAVSSAQQDDALEEVVVTGSRLGRSDLDSTLPITTLSEEDLETAGYQTVEDFLQSIPSVGSADAGSTVNNGNPGYATASLRGLGPNRTLILVNGRRIASAADNGIVDLNVIPSAMIERIEVLRDGASTIYGSDAVAGVINFITKKDFDGAELELQFDRTGESDGEQLGASFTVGSQFDKGNFVVSAQWTRRDAIWQRDRSFSECALGESNGQLSCIGSGTAYPANITPNAIVQNDPSGTSYVVDQSTGQLRPFGNADTFNFAAASYMVTPQEVKSLYGVINYDILESSDISSVTSFLELSFVNRTSDQLLAPVGTFWGAPVPADNPFNPFGNALCASNPACVAPQAVTVTRRMVETGGRGFSQDVDTYRFALGLEGELNNGIGWDVSYTYADWSDSQRDPGRANQPRFDTTLSPTLCAADANCPGVWDPFNVDTFGPAFQAYAIVNPNQIERSRMRQFQFNVFGDTFGLELPGGPIQWAVGFERRSESASVFPDGAALLGQVFFVAGQVTEGSYSVTEPYAELRFPVLSGMPFAQDLTFEASVRQSDYSFVSGSDVNTKFAVSWAPIEDIRFRAVTADGFRAPNVAELFSPQQKTASQYSDPCINYGTNPNQTIRDNCAADGLAPNFSLTSTQATGLQGGNPNLEPETSESNTFGIVFTPTFLPELSVTLDWFDISIDNAVGTVGTDNIITRCYQSPNFSSPLCNLLLGPGAVGEAASQTGSPRRNVLNNIAGQVLTNANLSSFETQGLDFTINYGWDSPIGELDFGLSGTYLDRYEFQAFSEAAPLELSGTFAIDPYEGDNLAIFPDLKLNFRVGLRRDNWGATLTTRWLDEVVDINSAPGNLVNVADSVTYVDLQGYYEWGDIMFTLGARNLTDEDPPYVSNYDDMNTIQYSYDTAGTYYYTRVGFKF